MKRRFFLPGASAWLLSLLVFGVYLMVSWFYVPGTVPSKIEISITATGKKNSKAKGSEVWIISAPGLNMRKKFPGWEIKNGRLVSYPGYHEQPVTLEWTTRYDMKRPIEFLEHPYSGIVKVKINGKEYTHDLFWEGERPRSKKIHIKKIIEEQNRWNPAIHAFLFVLIVFLAILYANRMNLVKLGVEYRASLLVLASSAIALHTLVSNQKMIGIQGVAISYLWFMSIVLVQILILGACRYFSGKKICKTKFFAFEAYDILVLTLFALNMVATFLYSLKGFSLDITISSLFILYSFAILSYARDVQSKSWFSILMVVGIILIDYAFARIIEFNNWEEYFFKSFLVGALAFIILYKAIRGERARNAVLIAFIVFIVSTFTKGILSLPSYEIIMENASEKREFKKINKHLPNIYFISFDGIYSQEAYSMFIEKNKNPVIEVLKKNGMKVRGVLSADDSTLLTFYRIFTFKKHVKRNFTDRGFLNGKGDNPALESFLKMGYKTQAILDSTYLGAGKGYFEYVYPTRKRPMDYCWSVWDNRYIHFFGICNIIFKISKRNYQIATEKLVERIKNIARQEAPWFTFSHIWLPGHVPNNFKFNDQKVAKAFIRRYINDIKVAARWIGKILKTIKRDDPNSIIIFHSDHGAKLAQGWSEKEDKEGLFTREKAILAMRGVPFAVYPKGFCKPYFSHMKETTNILLYTLDCLKRKKGTEEAP